MASITHEPGRRWCSAIARIAGSVGEVGWFSGYQVLSKSSAWAIVPFAYAAFCIEVLKPPAITDACGAPPISSRMRIETPDTQRFGRAGEDDGEAVERDLFRYLHRLGGQRFVAHREDVIDEAFCKGGVGHGQTQLHHTFKRPI